MGYINLIIIFLLVVSIVLLCKLVVGEKHTNKNIIPIASKIQSIVLLSVFLVYVYNVIYNLIQDSDAFAYALCLCPTTPYALCICHTRMPYVYALCLCPMHALCLCPMPMGLLA